MSGFSFGATHDLEPSSATAERPAERPVALDGAKEDNDRDQDERWQARQREKAGTAADGDARPDPFADLRDLPAIFWDQNDIDRAFKAGCPPADLAGLQSVLYDDQPPQEVAEKMKAKGNEALRLATKITARGAPRKARTQLRTAAEFYTTALAAMHPDAAANATYYANRAQAHLSLGNSGKALADCLSALALQPGHVKAQFRAAKAAADLGRYEAALAHCKAIAGDPANAELIQLQQTLEVKLAAKLQRNERLQAARSAARELAEAIASRGVIVGGQRGSSYGQEHVPYLDPGVPPTLRWPVLLLYGESMHSDILRDVSDCEPLSTQLDIAFGPDAPALVWDNRGAYTRATVRLYFQKAAAIPLTPPQLARRLLRGTDAEEPPGGDEGGGELPPGRVVIWQMVDESMPLGRVLAMPGHVVPGIPVFYVGAEGSEFLARMLSGEWNPPT